MNEWENRLSGKRMGDQKAATPDPTRSPFEQDFDRIIFSYPFRRLQDKTQVHPLPEHDFVHTRLTHSLEVSSVGRSLGKLAGYEILERYPKLKEHFTFNDIGAIVAAASLAHDIGNPPFGHSGETAISEFFSTHPQGKAIQPLITPEEWQDLIHFEGNAQGFRMLNRPQYQGLRLTYATLAAFTKYPREAALKNAQPDKASQKKYGYFQSEKHLFQSLAREINLPSIPGQEGAWSRHPLAFLVEAADDICYHIIDLEDGHRLGLINFKDTCELLAAVLGKDFKPEKLKPIYGNNEKIGMLRAVVINHLTREVANLFLDNEQDILSGAFDHALTNVLPSAGAMRAIKNISIEKIYRSRAVTETEAAGYEVVPGLLEVFIPALLRDYINKEGKTSRDKILKRIIPEETLYTLETGSEPSAYEVVRSGLDFISGMTDRFAVSLFKKIKGISIPGT